MRSSFLCFVSLIDFILLPFVIRSMDGEGMEGCTYGMGSV